MLEPSFRETRRIADPEAVLGDMHLAPVFNAPHILLDPYGGLQALAAALSAGAGFRDADGPARLHPGHPCAPCAELAAEAERAYDIAVEVRHTPVVMTGTCRPLRGSWSARPSES